MRFLNILVLLPFCALVACSDEQAQQDEVHYLTILHTNDHHGRFWNNERGEYGMAARKTLIDRIRAEVEAEGGYSLLLSGGDINTGVPESDTQDAEPDFRGMSLLGYDAMAVGNHEFDNSLETIRKQESWSNFPFLAANIYDKKGERLFSPYKVFEFNGLRVGVIGLITHTTQYIGNQEHIKDIEFTLPEIELAGLIDEVDNQVDAVIAVTHMGHSPIDMGTDVTLAEAIPNLDMIVGGHSAEAICMDAQGKKILNYRPGMPCVPDNVNGTLIVQAEDWGRYVGRADLKIQGEDVELINYRLIPVNLLNENDELVGERIEKDPDALALLQPFQEAGSSALGEVIGYANGDFSRAVQAWLPNTSPIGKLITQAMMDVVDVDIAIFNRGGIRDSILEGEITTRTVLQVQPFGNTLVIKTFSGLELIEYFKTIGLLPDNKSQIQFSGVYFDDAGKLKLTSTDASINPEAKYSIAMNNFMAQGGERFPVLTDLPNYMDTGLLDYQVLMDYIKANSPISP